VKAKLSFKMMTTSHHYDMFVYFNPEEKHVIVDKHDISETVHYIIHTGEERQFQVKIISVTVKVPK